MNQQIEEENGRKEMNDNREEEEEEKGEEEQEYKEMIYQDGEAHWEENNLLQKLWSQLKKSNIKQMLSRAQTKQIKQRKLRHFVTKFVDFQLLKPVDILLKIFIDQSQVVHNSISRLHFIILILQRIKQDSKILRLLIGITNQSKRITQISQRILAVKQSFKILKTTALLNQIKQSKECYNKDNLNDNVDVSSRNTNTTHITNKLHQVQRIINHLDFAIQTLKALQQQKSKFSKEKLTILQQQPQPASYPIQPALNQIPENNRNNIHEIPRFNANIHNSNPAVVYQVSLDLQVYQYIVKIIKSTMDHFDILCKVIIILSLTFMGISIHSILSDFQSNTKNIFATSDDIFLTSLEWLSMNKSSREIVGNFTLFVIFSSILVWRKLWEYIVCEFTDEDSVLVKKNALRFCMPKQLVLMKIMDQNMLSDHFEALIMCWQICLSDLSRISSVLISETISTLQDQDFAVALVKLNKMRLFNRILMAVNFLNLLIFSVIFSSIGPALLFRLIYGNIAAFLWNIRIEIYSYIISSQKGQLYYSSINLDSISKPIADVEIFFSFIHEILKLMQFSILICVCIANPPEVGFSVLLIYYFIFGVTSTVSKLRLAWTNYRRLRFFEKNLDVFFPRKIITDQNKDEICSICHENLSISRCLKDCPHSFHLKCIYQWIQTQQQQPRCPICRVPIANASQLNHTQPAQNRSNVFMGNNGAQVQGVANEQGINNYNNININNNNNNNNNNNEDENELLQQEIDHIPAELYVQPLVNL